MKPTLDRAQEHDQPGAVAWRKPDGTIVYELEMFPEDGPIYVRDEPLSN